MTAVQAVCVLALFCYASLAVIVLVRGRHRRSTWLFLLYLLTLGLWQTGLTVAAFGASTEMSLASYQLVIAFAGSTAYFYALFVRELLGLTAARALVWSGYVYLLAAPVYVALDGPGLLNLVHHEPQSSLFLPGVGVAPIIVGVFACVCLIYAFVHLAHARRVSTSSAERNRLLYLLIGPPVVIVGSTIFYLSPLRTLPIGVAVNLFNAAVAALAILPYRLLDIQLLVRKGLRYSVTTDGHQWDLLPAGDACGPGLSPDLEPRKCCCSRSSWQSSPLC